MGWGILFDDIVWGLSRKRVLKKQKTQASYNTENRFGYKPNAVTEMVMVYRKKKTDKLIRLEQ